MSGVSEMAWITPHLALAVLPSTLLTKSVSLSVCLGDTGKDLLGKGIAGHCCESCACIQGKVRLETSVAGPAGTWATGICLISVGAKH